MSIVLKSPRQVERIAGAGRVVAEALELAGSMTAPGVTTGEIDEAVEELIRSRGGIPTFKGYKLASVKMPYPASICASVNEEVVHGIPGGRLLEEGQILSVDVGVTLDGYIGDAARTFGVGEVAPEAQRLIDATRGCLAEAVAQVMPDNPLVEVSRAIQTHAEERGYSVVRDLVGHGVGEKMHEEPQIPNYVSVSGGSGVVLKPGMVLAIEPMVNLGGCEVRWLEDGWTVVTRDGSLSAHFENTIAVTEEGGRILTETQDG